MAPAVPFRTPMKLHALNLRLNPVPSVDGAAALVNTSVLGVEQGKWSGAFPEPGSLAVILA